MTNFVIFAVMDTRLHIALVSIWPPPIAWSCMTTAPHAATPNFISISQRTPISVHGGGGGGDS